MFLFPRTGIDAAISRLAQTHETSRTPFSSCHFCSGEQCDYPSYFATEGFCKITIANQHVRYVDNINTIRPTYERNLPMIDDRIAARLSALVPVTASEGEQKFECTHRLIVVRCCIILQNRTVVGKYP